MGTRRSRGKLATLSAPQTVSEGRPSRAKRTSTLAHRPTLPGEEGAAAALVFAVHEVAAGVEGAPNRLRHARKRAVAVLGRDGAREVEARARMDRASLAALKNTHEGARPRMFAAAVEAVATMREEGVETTTARAAIATGYRMRALGAALLDAGAATLDPDLLRAGASLVEAGRRELLFARDHEHVRRSAVPRGHVIDVRAAVAAFEATRATETTATADDAPPETSDARPDAFEPEDAPEAVEPDTPGSGAHSGPPTTAPPPTAKRFAVSPVVPDDPPEVRQVWTGSTWEPEGRGVRSAVGGPPPEAAARVAEMQAELRRRGSIR